jgi:hypothetical protein
MPLCSRIRTLLRPENSVADEHPPPQLLDCQPETPQPEVGSSRTPSLSGVSLSQRYAKMAQDLRLSMPFTCRWLDPEDIKLIGKHPDRCWGVRRHLGGDPRRPKGRAEVLSLLRLV